MAGVRRTVRIVAVLYLGHTGNPKGVLYSHRSDVLHALTLGGAMWFWISAQDTILPMTPMFHANGAWGFTHAAPMVAPNWYCRARNWTPPASLS